MRECKRNRAIRLAQKCVAHASRTYGDRQEMYIRRHTLALRALDRSIDDRTKDYLARVLLAELDGEQVRCLDCGWSGHESELVNHAKRAWSNATEEPEPMIGCPCYTSWRVVS